MADIFYKGEDISLQIELFEKGSSSDRVEVSDVEVDLLVYTKPAGDLIRMSTHRTEMDILPITKDVETNMLRAHIPATITRLLSSGMMTFEMMTIENVGLAEESRKISVCSQIYLQPSKIGVL